tara:strand:+ start:323 stop:520 length:198 start_codon:yes stop_codon:yes gene_type:complete
MQDLLIDIEELQRIEKSVGVLFDSTVKTMVQEMIERKQSEVNKITNADDKRAFDDYLKGGKSWVE